MNLLQGLGQAQPVTGFIDTALKYRSVTDDAAFRRQETENLKVRQRLLEQEEVERERSSRPKLLSELVGKGSESGRPNMMKLYSEAAKIYGNKIVLPDGSEDYTITKDDMPLIMRHLETQKDFHPQMLWATHQDNTQQIVEKEKALAKAKTPVEREVIELDIEKLKAMQGSILKELGKGTEGFTLGENQKRFDATGTEIASGPAKEEEKWSDPTPMVIDGKTVMTQKSSKTGQIRTVAQGQTTNVNVDVDMGLSKGARAKAEEDVQEATDMFKGLENLTSISKPEFFTYAGQLQAGAEKVGEKAGVVKDPKFLGEYSAWKAGTEQEFNKYRKWATGVAAGEKELERLANSFPNVNMSKTQYMAAARLTAANAWKLAERRRRALSAGIMDPGKQKDFYKLLPLDAMPDPPPDIMQRFSPQGGGINPEDALSELRRRGVIP